MNTTPRPETQLEKAAPIARTPWHRILAKLLELLLTPLGITVQTELPVMSEPPKVDILLVRRSGKRWTEQQLRLLCDGLRHVLAATLIIEFKFSESLTVEALRQALGYDYFFRMAQRLAESEVATFVMVARTPRSGVLEELGYEVGETPGVYRTHQPVLARVQIIVLNQLRPEAHNFFVQQFASQRRVRRAAFDGLQQNSEELLNEALFELVVGLQGRFEVQEGEMGKLKEHREEEVITPESLMKVGREIRRMVVATMRPEERLAVIASMKPEERKVVIATLKPEERKAVIAALKPEERLAGLAPEDRLAGLAPKQRLAGLRPEELAELMQEIDLYLHRQGNTPTTRKS